MKLSSACHRPVLAAPIQTHISHQPGWLQIHLRQHRIIPGIFSRRLTLGQVLGQTFLSSRLCARPGVAGFCSLEGAEDTLRDGLERVRVDKFLAPDASVSLRLFFAPLPAVLTSKTRATPPEALLMLFPLLRGLPPVSVVQVCPPFPRGPASSWKEAHLF